MSRVIKNDDGVVVVEGTPASTLVKDSDKFFATKAPERMAGESISQPKRIDPRAINTRSPIQREPDPRAINTRQPTPKDLEQMNNPPIEESAIRSGRKREVDELVKQQAEEEGRGRGRGERRQVTPKKRGFTDERRTSGGRPVGGNPNRNEAKDKAESRRKRFFERRRSKKEAERSQEEQEATQGRFITTLGR